MIVSDYLSGELAMHSRRIRDAYEGYNQLRVVQRPLQGVYLSVFLIMTLAAAEAAVGLAIIIALSRLKGSTDVDDISLLKW